jgi:prepilin peptidase CpaA
MEEAARLAFLGFLLMAAASDVARLRIPNGLIVLGLVIACTFLLATPAPWLPHLAVGGVAFGVTFALFAMNLIGGGDAKLFPVVALWCGPEATRDFLLVLAVLAPLFALTLVAARGLVRLRERPAERLPPVLRRGAGVPLAVPTLPAAALFL